MNKFLVLLAAILLATCIGLYLTRTKSVLFRFGESSIKSTGSASFALFNPFRDRSTEQKAAAFLERVKTQPCFQVLDDLHLDQQYFQYLCQMEGEHRLIDWRLADREESGNTVRLFYWANRVPNADFKSQLWIKMEKTGDLWKVVGYESWY